MHRRRRETWRERENWWTLEPFPLDMVLSYHSKQPRAW
jgi:hypothetical protein